MIESGSGSRIPIAIAGGGIIGLSIAWRLAQAGHKVAVFEQAVIGGEASWAGAGMLAPGGELEENTSATALALESRALYQRFVRQIEDDSDLPIDYQECGALDVAYSEDEMARLERRAQLQHALGIASKHITRSHVMTFWPRVRREGLVGGRFYPGDAIVNPRELTHALRRAILKRSGSVSEHEQIRSVEALQDCAVLVTQHGKRVADIAVVAAGAWSGQIAVSGVPPLPVSEPVKGQLIGYQQPEQTCNTIVRHGDTYLLQRANGLLIAGSSMERVGFDRDVNPFIEAGIAKRAGFVLPHLSETTHSESWMGFRPASDNLHIGAWHSPRLYLAYGHLRNGILLAPATAERITAEINANWQKHWSASASSPQ